MVTMGGMRQLWRIFLVAAVVGIAALVFGQDAPDTQAPTGQASATGVAPASVEDSELAAEVQRLRNDVDRLKRQVAYLNSVVDQLENERVPVERVTTTRPPAKTPKKGATANAPAIVADTPAPAPDVEEKVTKTVLVFRDGHKTEAVNYAIVGQTLWIYTETDSKKVPLADLDVAATKSANADRGVTFQVPPTK
jgi:outer membrane murein-binding lipoprotein Lpp